MQDESKDLTRISPPRIRELLAERFEITAELGRGTSGSVYRARLRRPLEDLPIGTDVALKILHERLLGDPGAQARLEAEGRLGQRLRSEHVVEVYATGTLDPQGTSSTYLVMELIRGRTLRQTLDESGSVVEDLARRIGRDSARGLRSIHALGLVHGDIKPENLALTDEGAVKIMDLGLARKKDHPRKRGSGSGFHGNLRYAAPEVLRGLPATERSDLYSLGVVLFEVVTGQHPFAAACADADILIDAHLKKPPPRPSHLKPRISAFLEQLILDLMAKSPDNRPASAAELAATLEREENSRYWLRHEQRAPRLASRRRLRSLLRVAEVPFVGRRRELRQLDRHLRSALEGRGRCVFVTGPWSMGRRRMLDHWLQHWFDRRNELTFLGGEAEDGQGILRAAPFAEMILEWYLRGDRPESPQAKARLASRIADATRLPPSDVEQLAAIASGTDESASPAERADLLARHLIAMCPKDQTLVLRVDRVEKLSSTATLVVQRLLQGIGKQNLLLVLVALDGTKPPGPCHHVPLEGLAEEDFFELGKGLFAGRKAPEELLRRAHSTLAGSPGNLIDALAMLRREHKLSGTAGNYRPVAEVVNLRPAAPLLDRLRQRLQALSQAERFVHLAAAVLGDTFPISDLAALVGQSEIAILESLSVFQGRIILTQRGTGRFRHREFRQVIQNSAKAEDLRRLHRTAAWILEDRGAPALDVGLHLSRAGEHEAAIEPLLEGLGQLTATGSRKSSLKISGRLRVHLDAREPGEATDRLKLRHLLLAGRAEELASEDEQALDSLGEAADMALALGDRPAMATARVAIARLDLAAGRFKAALGSLREAATQDTAEPLLTARALGIEARVLGYLGQSAKAIERLHRAIGVLPEGDDDLLPHMHIDLGRLLALRTEFSESIEEFDRAQRLFRQRGSKLGRMRVLLHRGHLLGTLGNWDRSARMLHDATDLARQLADPRTEARALLFIGEHERLRGRPAIDHLDGAAILAAAAGDLTTHLWAQVYLAELGVHRRGLGTEVEALGLPSLEIAWLLGAAQRENDPGLLARAESRSQGIDLPIHLRRRLLRSTGDTEAAVALEKRVASRLPFGSLRRHFTALVRSGS